MISAYYWILGLSTSVVGGGFVTFIFLSRLRAYMHVHKEKTEEGGVRRAPPWLTGAIERMFFTLVIAFEVPGAPAAMLIWITLKMATNWNSLFGENKDDAQKRGLAFSSLLAGLVSMTFALIGGVICLGAGK